MYVSYTAKLYMIRTLSYTYSICMYILNINISIHQ